MPRRRAVRRSARLKSKPTTNYIEPNVADDDFENNPSESSDSEGQSDDSDSAYIPHDETLYCICRQPEAGRIMIGCDECNEWFHIECINLTQSEAEKLDNYYCSQCTEKRNKKKKSRKRRRSSSSRSPRRSPRKKRKKTNDDTIHRYNTRSRDSTSNTETNINHGEPNHDDDEHEDDQNTVNTNSDNDNNQPTVNEDDEKDDDNDGDNSIIRAIMNIPITRLTPQRQRLEDIMSRMATEIERSHSDSFDTSSSEIIDVVTTNNANITTSFMRFTTLPTPFVVHANSQKNANDTDTDLEIISNVNNNKNNINANNDNNIDDNSDDDDIMIQAGDSWIESNSFLQNKEENMRKIKEHKKKQHQELMSNVKCIDDDEDDNNNTDLMILNKNNDKNKTLICPLTLKPMTIPIKNVLCKHKYEKSAIKNYKEYLTKNNKPLTCPQAGCGARLWVM